MISNNMFILSSFRDKSLEYMKNEIFGKTSETDISVSSV